MGIESMLCFILPMDICLQGLCTIFSLYCQKKRRACMFNHKCCKFQIHNSTKTQVIDNSSNYNKSLAYDTLHTHVMTLVAQMFQQRNGIDLSAPIVSKLKLQAKQLGCRASTPEIISVTKCYDTIALLTFQFFIISRNGFFFSGSHKKLIEIAQWYHNTL